MRTPNCECIVCSKPLYRRPGELSRVRHVACMEHRAEAQRRDGQTKAQLAALALGREKGTNHLDGIPKSEESKCKRSKSIARWCRENPDKLKKRSEKTRGPNHYRWNGGASKLNISIRQMTENRRWMDNVKKRDGACVKCGSTSNMESHHIKPLSNMLKVLRIKSRDDAREHADKLWCLDNGITLCQKCHYKEHRRTYAN